MDREALLKLADQLETYPWSEKELFFMGNWKTENKCGAAACVAGWFCIWNPDDDLRLESRYDEDSGFFFTPVFCHEEQKYLGLEALRKRFKLSHLNAEYIFFDDDDDDDDLNPKSASTPQERAARIREVVEGRV